MPLNKLQKASAAIGQGIVSPFLRFGATANSALRGTVNLTKAAMGDRDALGREARAQQNEAQSPQYLRPALTAREVVGTGLQIGTAIGGGGLTKGIVDLTGGMASRAAVGALSGGVLGLTGGAGVGLEQSGARRLGAAGTVDLTARSGVVGAAMGAGIGGAVGAIGDKWNAPRKPDELDRLLSEADDLNKRAKAGVMAQRRENELLKAGGEAVEGEKAMPKTPFPGPGAEGTTPHNHLFEEAGKYATPEEFVKAQTNAYHGTSDSFTEFKLQDGKNLGPNAIFVSPQKEVASYYSQGIGKGGSGKIVDVNLSTKNLFDYEDSTHLSGINKFLEKNYQKIIDGSNLNPEVVTVDYLKNSIAKGDYSIIENPIIQKFIKNAGYDGFKIRDYTGGEGIGIFDVSKIKTSSQLTDIWNKAHKK